MSDHYFDALDKEMLVEIAIGQKAENERLRAEVKRWQEAYADAKAIASTALEQARKE